MARDAPWRVLVSATYLLPVLERYADMFARHGITIIVPPQLQERLQEAALLPLIGDVDGVMCGDDQFTAAVFAAAPRLKVISKWGTGIDAIDQEAARRHGVAVYNTPDAFTDAVADTVLGYILCWARRLVEMDRHMRMGQWDKVPGVALHERALGIIGVGRIGKAVASRARACGMQVLGYDRVEMPAAFLDASQVRMVSKETLLAQADFVSLHCDLNSTSFHVIGMDELQRMKRTAYLINTARGPIIDEAALAQALQERQIAGAALDVFEEEPLPADSPLRAFEHCLLAPHNANSSPSAAQRVHDNTIQQLIHGLLQARGAQDAPMDVVHA